MRKIYVKPALKAYDMEASPIMSISNPTVMQGDDFQQSFFDTDTDSEWIDSSDGSYSFWD